MITRPTARRIAFARESIADYCRQTHAARELLIVIDGSTEQEDAAALTDHVRGLDRADIRLHRAPPGLRLGALRNLGVEAAAGDVICQWDDDDRYHPRRLERQFALLESGAHEAVYLQEVMQYFPDDHAIHLTNWRGTPGRGHPGTLMMRRSAAIPYPETDLGEDLAVALSLVERGGAGYLQGEPHLHLYVSHGANSWDAGHHAMLARELSVSVALLRRREETIRAGLAPFAFPAGGVDVVGSNGIAFRL